jgi:hypothetical protein
MIFAADIIPKELKSIIEFLNEQMSRAEVLGIEIKQYEKGAQKVFVPRVIGNTVDGDTKKTRVT